MKIISHITCIIAIIAQIFLSTVAFAHDVTCQSSRSYTITEKSQQVETPHTHSCGCCHSHHAEQVTESSNSDSPESAHYPDNQPAPCTCSSEPSPSFIAGDYSIETRERKISRAPIFSADIYNAPSFLNLPCAPRLNDILASIRDRIGMKERTRSIYLAQHSGRFVSTHLSKFSL